MKYSVFAFVALASAFGDEIEDAFNAFIVQHNRDYTPLEKVERFEYFKQNYAFIYANNGADAGGSTHEMTLNQFADLSDDELYRQLNGYIESGRPKRFWSPPAVPDAPSSLDWKHCTTVRDQGSCGSCWAFSAVGALESRLCAAGTPSPPLSEQHLVDCSGTEGNYGCNGGLMDYAYEFIRKNGGICSAKDYPYKAMDGKCKKCTPVAMVSGFADLEDEDAVLAALQEGPVAVAISAERDFMLYNSGIYSGSCKGSLNHAVLLVGYGTEGSTDYWLVKNSWGVAWGEKGYVRMQRGRPQDKTRGICGLLSAASIPFGSLPAVSLLE